MKCADWESRLGRFLDGSLETLERQEWLAHAASCHDCGQLLRLVEHDHPLSRPSAFVNEVLTMTSGQVCESAQERLWEAAANRLGVDDRELLSRHLEECEDCQGLLSAMGGLQEVLPKLASFETDETFVEEVLQRTLPARARFRRWWALQWQAWVRRPRFAWEGAYIATLVLILVASVPGSPIKAMPAQAAALTRQVPKAGMGRGREQIEKTIGQLAAEADEVWERAVDSCSELLARVESTSRSTASVMWHTWDEAAETGRTFWHHLASQWSSEEEGTSSD